MVRCMKKLTYIDSDSTTAPNFDHTAHGTSASTTPVDHRLYLDLKTVLHDGPPRLDLALSKHK